jgi:hypothetical protein
VACEELACRNEEGVKANAFCVSKRCERSEQP